MLKGRQSHNLSPSNRYKPCTLGAPLKGVFISQEMEIRPKAINLDPCKGDKTFGSEPNLKKRVAP